jgi:preprotein translocase subunit SecG
MHILFCVSIIVIVLLQSGKQAGLSGSIAGGAETFFGKNKGRTIDAMLSKYTAFAAILFLVTSLVLGYIINISK